MSLSLAIEKWNGKSADEIAVIYDLYHDKQNFHQKIIGLIESKLYQNGASWLLKHDFELGGHLNNKEITKVYELLSKVELWEARLHLLQSIEYMPISQADIKHVESFLRLTLSDSNKFVRAWSYNGFYLLAKQHVKYQEEVSHFFEMAMRDEAPSVKARIRNILKTGF